MEVFRIIVAPMLLCNGFEFSNLDSSISMHEKILTMAAFPSGIQLSSCNVT